MSCQYVWFWERINIRVLGKRCLSGVSGGGKLFDLRVNNIRVLGKQKETQKVSTKQHFFSTSAHKTTLVHIVTT